MTQAFVVSSIAAAPALALFRLASSGVDPLLEYIQNGASVAAIMGLFLWREMKRAERYENLYDEERKLRIAAENKCSHCPFIRQAGAAGVSPPSPAAPPTHRQEGGEEE